MPIRRIIAVLLFCCSVNSANAGTDPTLVPLGIPFTMTPPIIDGRFADPVWQISIPLPMVENNSGAPAGQSTTVKLLYDRQNIYAAFNLTDSIVFNQGDEVGLFLRSPGNGDTGSYLKLTVNPDNVHTDTWVDVGTDRNANVMINRDITGIISRTGRTAHGWQVELKIPWQMPGESGQPGAVIWFNAISTDRDDRDSRRSDTRCYSLSPIPGGFRHPPTFLPFLLEAPEPDTKALLANLPPLLVIIVAEQFRWDYIENLLPFFPDTGFFRNAARDGKIVRGSFRSMPTATLPGYATIFTGKLPREHGMVNDYWRVDTRSYGCLPTPLVPTLADRLIGGNPRSRTVIVSEREPGALALGRTGLYLDPISGGKLTYPRRRVSEPEWLKDYWDQHPSWDIPEHSWAPLYDYDTIPRVTPDSCPWERDDYGSTTFPKSIPGNEEGQFSGWYRSSPFLTTRILELGKQAVLREGLGMDTVPDLLILPLSAMDNCGHQYGAYSREVTDHLFRMDRDLGELVRWLTDNRTDSYELIFTSTSGIGPVPEAAGGRWICPHNEIERQMWNLTIHRWNRKCNESSVFPYYYLVEEAYSDVGTGVPVSEVARFIRDNFRMEGVSRLTPLPPPVSIPAIWNGYYPERSGQLAVELDPENSTGGAQHYSAYPCDREVPVIFYHFDQQVLQQLPSYLWIDQLVRYLVPVNYAPPRIAD